MTYWFSFFVLAREYRVYLKDVVLLDGRDCYGMVNHAASEVYLRRDLTNIQLIETLLHEMTHALLHALQTDTSNEEQVCWHIGSGLAQTVGQYVKLPEIP